MYERELRYKANMITFYELLILMELINALLTSIIVLTSHKRTEQMRLNHQMLEQNIRISERINDTVNSSSRLSEVKSKEVD